ncbi:secretin N-terminal domain-containing protein [Marinobacter piscensis]|uniref:secretin N-terminal domain-containing protein n=1 Tax=Marinobacter piscensis TaxID=1562308 RepID=UPI00119CF9DF|nr:secretin N-terminal domain-containing protein [Marinobacter piscensis]
MIMLFKRSPLALATSLALGLLTGCAATSGGQDDAARSQAGFQPKDHFRVELLDRQLPQGETKEPAAEAGGDSARDVPDTAMKAEWGPSARGRDTGATVGLTSDDGPELTGDPISLELNDLPLPVFINEVFGEKLGLSFSLAPSLADKTDLVTLRLSTPLEPSALFRTARSVLADYGVAMEQKEGLWVFSPAENVSTQGVPLLVSGEALPDVPASHRPVFQVIPLHVVGNTQIRSVVSSLFKGGKLEITDDPVRNAIILKGDRQTVAEAAQAVTFFDRPMLQGRNSVVLRPVYRDVGSLAAALQDILAAEGFAVGRPGGTGVSMSILPLPELGSIVVLGRSREILSHARQWAEKLDQDFQREIESGMFTYEVQNTSAEELASLLSQLYGGSELSGSSRSRSGESNTGGDNSSEQGGSTNERKVTGSGSTAEVAGGRLVVDKNRNVLIFRGSGADWLKLRDIAVELDKQVPSVLMEVVLAEVTLNDNQGMGVEWLARNSVGDLSGTLETLGGLGIGGRGFSYTLNSAGQTRAVLNAFYDSNQAVIRSSPKIMVKSGETATIEVGNEIPVLTSTRQSDTQTDGDTDVLQQFQYRKTGVDLTVEPIVQASGLVDIRIRQSLSETQDTSGGDSFLPTILNRAVETSLTLRDGGSVVLGGLISKTNSQGEQGVPWLGKLPLLGPLFRTDSDSTSTTELMVMVVPYVVRNDEEARNVSELLRERIQNSSTETWESTKMFQ